MSETQRADRSTTLRGGVGLQPRVSWRPLETAPKDGTQFQCWFYNSAFKAADPSAEGFWEPRCKYDEHGALVIWGRVDYDQDGWDVYPHLHATHWMPQPEAPADS